MATKEATKKKETKKPTPKKVRMVTQDQIIKTFADRLECDFCKYRKNAFDRLQIEIKELKIKKEELLSHIIPLGRGLDVRKNNLIIQAYNGNMDLFHSLHDDLKAKSDEYNEEVEEVQAIERDIEQKEKTAQDMILRQTSEFKMFHSTLDSLFPKTESLMEFRNRYEDHILKSDDETKDWPSKMEWIGPDTKISYHNMTYTMEEHLEKAEEEIKEVIDESKEG